MAAFSPMARLKIFTKQKVAEGFFNDVDVVVFPGGDGEATAFRSVLKPNLPDVRSYMQRGGKYLGICMGAYWADAYYFNLLKGTRCVQYIKRPRADIRSSYGTVTPGFDRLPFGKPKTLVHQKSHAAALARKYPPSSVVAVCGQSFAADPANDVVLILSQHQR